MLDVKAEKKEILFLFLLYTLKADNSAAIKLISFYLWKAK